MLWNDALEERIECHRKTGQIISAYKQCESLTEIRHEDITFSQFHANCQRSVLFRLDRAFKALFRRQRADPLMPPSLLFVMDTSPVSSGRTLRCYARKTRSAISPAISTKPIRSTFRMMETVKPWAV